MLAEMARLSSQQRPLYCYLLMSVWIFLLVAGMYKYISTVEMLNMPKQSMLRRDSHHSFRGDNKLKKIIAKFCNAPENIQINSEGLPIDEPWSLQGVITIIRHGDRGPLTHVRDIENVNCDATNPTSMLQRYQEYINNATGSGRAPWAQSPGPFHNFPLLPSAPTTACRLGQLTLVGIQQLLMTGTLLGKAYSTRFGWSIHSNNTNQTGINDEIFVTKQQKNEDVHAPVKLKENLKETVKTTKIEPKNNVKASNTKHDPIVETKSTSSKPTEGDIVVHSTRYRRALQSALALIWSMLDGSPSVASAIAHESPSLAFCSTDCACPAADNYAKILSRELKDRLETHPAIGALVTQLSKVISQSPSQISSDPHILEDALLAYLCHAAPLPCVEKIIDIPQPVKKSSDSHKQKAAANVKSESKIRNLLKSHDNPLRRLLFSFPSDKFPESNLHRVRRDIKLRSFDMRPKPVPLDFDSQMEKEKLGYYQQKLLENADSNYQDVILVKRNMDGDFNFNGDSPNILDGQDTDDSDDYEEKLEDEQKKGKSSNTETLCIRKDQVTGLFAYTDWEMKQSVKSKNLKKVSLLRAYGMIRHIVQYVLRMISENKPKFVLYSGHDKTLQYLSLALGLSPDNFLHIQYASRIIIEVYKNVNKDHPINDKVKNSGTKTHSRMTAPLDFYFRLIMNGVDVTNQLSFCKGKNHISIESNKSANFMDKNKKHYLCRIENIIRFTHEDYFTVFNATNFKDACSVH